MEKYFVHDIEVPEPEAATTWFLYTDRLLSISRKPAASGKMPRTRTATKAAALPRASASGSNYPPADGNRLRRTEITLLEKTS
jgi:hypothetical protein